MAGPPSASGCRTRRRNGWSRASCARTARSRPRYDKTANRLKFDAPLPIPGKSEREETVVPNRIKGLDGGSIGPGSGNPIEKISITKPVPTGGSNSAPTTEADSVHITQSARSLQVLSQAVQDSPDIDTARVSAVQQQIESGQ